MEDTIQQSLDERLERFLDPGEKLRVEVRGNVVVNHPDAGHDAEPCREYILGVTESRLLAVRLGSGNGRNELDASIPLRFLAGVSRESYDAVDELVVRLTTGASVRFEIPIGGEHAAEKFASHVHALVPTQVIAAADRDLEPDVSIESSESAATVDDDDRNAGREQGDTGYYLRVYPDSPSRVPESRCEHCGAVGKPGAVFCRECGTVL